MYERAINLALGVMVCLARMRAAVAADARAALQSVEFEGALARIAIGDLCRAGTEARRRLIEALVMAAGGAPAAPRREATETLVSHLVDAARPFGGATLGGAWIRRQGGAALLGPAPPRRGETAGPDPAWDRAAALLADPGLDALAV
jgi:hypothetical protein